MRPFLFVGVLAFASHTAAQLATPVARQPFRSGTELVLVDVTVLDGRGAPVPGLAASDFRLSVGGRPRPIHSVQFIRTEPSTVAAAPRDLDSSTNQLPASGRLVLIVVDESNLRPGAPLAVVRAAEQLLTRLSPGDLVGVARIPYGGGTEFTANRTRVIDALKRITGRPPRARPSSVTVYISEAADFEDSGRQQWPAALKRECGEPNTPGYSLCVSAMKMEALAILREEEQKRSTTISTLFSLVKSADAAGAPVTMVLISESLFLGRDRGALTGLAAAGSAARVSLHVVRPATSSFDTGSAGFSSDPSWDEEMRRTGLQMLAAQFRGAFHEIAAVGTHVFEQISVELSGYYLLGVDATNDDRTGRARRLRVEVTRPGLTVRARPTFAIPAVEPAPADVAGPDRLRALVSSPVPSRDLPMTVATSVIAGREPDRVRLLVAAEIGVDIDRLASYQVGIIVLDDKGEVVSQWSGAAGLSPARDGLRSPALFTTSFELAPGEYAIRLAAIDPQGRAGSVHHSVAAMPREWPDGFRTSDLIVAPRPPDGQFPLFTPSFVIDGNEMAAVIDVAHRQAPVLEEVTVTFEIAAEDDGRVLIAVAAVAGTAEGRRMFSKVFGIAGLPAADYVARAVVLSAGRPVATVIKAFRRERRRPGL